MSKKVTEGTKVADLKLATLRAIKGSMDNALELADYEQTQLVRAVSVLKTPKSWIKQRKGRDKKVFDYIEGGRVVRALNVLFGLYWKASYQVIDRTDKYALVECTLEVYNPKLGVWVARADVGGKEVVVSKRTGEVVTNPIDLLKSAYTDSLKRAARHWGLFLDLWISDEARQDKQESKALDDLPATVVATQYTKRLIVAYDKGELKKEELERALDLLQVMSSIDKANASVYAMYSKLIQERLNKSK